MASPWTESCWPVFITFPTSNPNTSTPKESQGIWQGTFMMRMFLLLFMSRCNVGLSQQHLRGMGRWFNNMGRWVGRCSYEPTQAAQGPDRTGTGGAGSRCGCRGCGCRCGRASHCWRLLTFLWQFFLEHSTSTGDMKTTWITRNRLEIFEIACKPWKRTVIDWGCLKKMLAQKLPWNEVAKGEALQKTWTGKSTGIHCIDANGMVGICIWCLPAALILKCDVICADWCPSTLITSRSWYIMMICPPLPW